MDERTLLLIVEDDAALRGRLTRAFDARGFDVRGAATYEDAVRLAEQAVPELVVLDLHLGDGHGLSLIAKFKQADPNTRIVVLTGYGSIATAIEAVRQGAVHYLTKPADADEILAAFERGVSGQDAPLPLQPMSLDRVEWEHINRVLVGCGGNISETARMLGLHRRSLQRKLSKYPSAR